MYMMQGTRTVCVSLLQPTGGRKSRVQKFACLGFSGQVSYDTGSYACQPTTAYAIVFLIGCLRTEQKAPVFLLLEEAKERRDHIHTDLLQQWVSIMLESMMVAAMQVR